MSRLFCITLAASLAAFGCSKPGGQDAPKGGPGGGGPRGAMKFPVEVQPVGTRDVEYALSAVGTVEAFEKVQVTARVAGVVEKVAFVEGLEVDQGRVLAEVEPQRYQLAVDAAKAAVDKALAERDEAQAALTRREAVEKQSPGLIPREELESFRTRATSAQAEAQARKVALEQAKLNLRDAYVRAPVRGIIETRTVQTGQYVQPGAVLATLLRRDPLLLRFKVPELDAARISNGMVAKFTTGDDQQTYRAKINHVGGAADPKTRMVEVTAEVDDEKREALRPGSFAQVTVPVATRKAPVIPQLAVRPSERGFLAYVVDDNDIARERVVTLGLRTPDGYVEVKDGLAPGERLVVRGAEALRDGAGVRLGAPAKGPEGRGERSEADRKDAGRTGAP